MDMDLQEPEGGLTPHLAIGGGKAAEAIDFYKRAFGAEELLAEWDRILQLPPILVASRMLDPSEHGRDLRQVTPFAGILDARTRAAVYRTFRTAA